jgi:hypothetical protein
LATVVIEIRSYVLKPGVRERLHELLDIEISGLLRDAGIRVVRYGPSLHDDTSYVLIRAFDSLTQLQEQEDRFYGSDTWKNTYRETILDMIESWNDIVIDVDESAVAALTSSSF